MKGIQAVVTLIDLMLYILGPNKPTAKSFALPFSPTFILLSPVFSCLSLLPLQIASSSSSFPLTILVACNAAPENRSPKQRSEVQVLLYISQLSGKVGNITLLCFYTTTDIYRQSTHGGKKMGRKSQTLGFSAGKQQSLLMQT